MNERIVIRHRNLAKINQLEAFPVRMFKELTAGRESDCDIKFDPDRDDLVSRRHAKIVIGNTEPVEFSITDLGSLNGTFVNKQRISKQTVLRSGDVIQFGSSGPEFQVDVE